MSAIYFAIPTDVGQERIANAIALGVPIKITQMAVGDGNGQPVTPKPDQTALVHEVRRAPLNTLFQDPINPAQLVAEQIIPEDVGGWWIREIGLYDDSDNLIAIANAPDTYKPNLSSGSGRTLTIRMVLIVSDTSAVELKIDPSVVLATRNYVDDAVANRSLALLRLHSADAAIAMGHSLVAGSFENGATITSSNQVLLKESTGDLYSWGGALPYKVPKNSTPASSGGESHTTWRLRTPPIENFNAAVYGLKETNTGLQNCQALQALAAAVTAAGGGKITFPRGVYTVGAQTFAGATGKGYSYKAEECLTILNLPKVHLDFDGCKFIFADGMRNGSFDPVTGLPYNPPEGGFYSYDYRAERGRMIRLEGCKDVFISGNAEFDGNSITTVVGGMWGDTGYQTWDTGIYIRGHRRLIALGNTYCHDFNTDGAYFAGKQGSDCYSKISGLISIKTGRNTVTIAGGDNIHMIDSACGYQGQNGSGLSSMPKSAMDIETEINPINGIKLERVNFYDAPDGLVSDSFNNIKNAKFIDCKFHAGLPNTSCMTWKISNALFKRCKFYGPCVAIGPSANAGQDWEDIVLDECEFSAHMPDGTLSLSRRNSYFLFGSTNAITTPTGKVLRTFFKNCKFSVLAIAETTSDVGLKKAAWMQGAKIHDCDFYLKGTADLSTGGTRDILSLNGAGLKNVRIYNEIDFLSSSNERTFIGINTPLYSENCYLFNKASSVDGKSTLVWANPFLSAGGTYGWLTTVGSSDLVNNIQPVRALSIRKGAQFSPELPMRYNGGQIIQSTSSLTWIDGMIVNRGDIILAWNSGPGQEFGWQCTTAGLVNSTAVLKKIAMLEV
ncbi:phage tail protein [Aeromonas sp. ARM81]|uniref:phage tail-collar fiber domain-containing protein n=1 Tax=Aeromonas sp. ARM81 TaxID=1747384 RepID=UPI00090A5ED1|nr:phage tail protein [Aeromonas sp. ARM81]ALN97536.1 tail-collar fiber protein [Aeromonas phage phiARM81ld]